MMKLRMRLSEKEIELKVDQNVEESISFQSQEENKLNEAKEIIDERLERIKKSYTKTKISSRIK